MCETVQMSQGMILTMACIGRVIEVVGASTCSTGRAVIFTSSTELITHYIYTIA